MALVDIVKKGSVDRSVPVYVFDNTTGLPISDRAYNSAGIDLWYRREGAAKTTITEATLAALTTAHSDGGFLVVADGEYRLDLPDAAFATAANYVDYGGTMTGYTVVGGRVRLVDVDLEDTVRMGLTALPNVASGSAGAVITSGTGTAQLSVTSGVASANAVQVSGDSTAADNLELAFDGTGYAGGTIPQQVVLTTNGVNAVADGVWDEDITGHRAANAAGAMLQPLHSGACQAGGNTTTVVLASTASSADDYYNGDLLAGWITADGTGQFADYILDYVGATRTATVTGIGVSPTTTSTYVIHPGGTIPGASAPAASDNAAAVWNAVTASFTAAGSFGQAMGGEVTRANTAQAGTTSSITLDASASATTNLYRYHRVEILGGTGSGQSSYGTAYNGTSKVLTVDPAFAVAPSSDSIFILRKAGLDAATPAIVADAVWDEARSGHATAGSFGEYAYADVVRISSDATAADNAEAFFDGTGYIGTGNTIPTVTTVGSVTGAVGSVTGAVGSVTGAVGSVTGAVGSVTGAVGSVAGNVGGNVVGSVGSVTTVSDKTGYALSNGGIDALFTRALTESYAADGAAPTVAQALLLIQQVLTELSISTVTGTVKKLDGSTTAATLTYNDATSPTSVTRAT